MIDFDRMIDDYLKREHRPRGIGKYYPSEIGGCMRKTWYGYKHPQETKADLIRIFEIGEIIHDFVVDVLKSEKTPEVELIGAEVPFKINMKDYVVSGRVDDLILVKADGKKMLIEVKSTGNIDYVHYPKLNNELQLIFYMFATKIHNGALLYVDKRNLKSKIFEVKYEEARAVEVISRFNNLHKSLVEGLLPKPEAKLDEETEWMCRYCEYKDKCDKDEK